MGRMNKKELKLTKRLGKQLKCPNCLRRLKLCSNRENWFKCPKCEMIVKLIVIESAIQEKLIQSFNGMFD